MIIIMIINRELALLIKRKRRKGKKRKDAAEICNYE